MLSIGPMQIMDGMSKGGRMFFYKSKLRLDFIQIFLIKSSDKSLSINALQAKDKKANDGNTSFYKIWLKEKENAQRFT